MALNKTTLSSLIKTKVEAATGGTLPAHSLLVLTAFADAIVTHITTSGIVAVVTSCPAGAGTGTGTVT